MSIVSCRNCGTRRAKGDPCAGCGAGLEKRTIKIRKSRPISLTNNHQFHSPMIVPARVARALIRF